MRDIVDRRYRVEQRLAAGGFGAIYRATDLQIGRQVALKILHRELAGDANVVARFRRETATLARLKNPHTLTMYDVGETDDSLYFVMELLRGESLEGVLDGAGSLPWRRAVHVARGVCDSLREAHALGIVHRDLKPANIFLEQHALAADYVKVIDFGIAKIVTPVSAGEHHDLTRHGQMIGTFDYMAPEQMVGAPCTIASDVFTLGVVLYEMIAGSRPHGDAENPAQMMMALLTTSPRALSGVPPELGRIVMRCIAREPRDRPTVEQLDAVLARCLALPSSAFDVDDEPTQVTQQPVRTPSPGARTTLPRGSAQPLQIAALTVDGAPAAHVASAVVARTALLESSPPAALARGSRAAIGRSSEADIARVELELAETVSVAAVPGDFAEGTDAAAQPVRTRLASGTSPIPERVVSTSSEIGIAAELQPERATMLRYIVILACLFGLGFLGALVIWSL